LENTLERSIESGRKMDIGMFDRSREGAVMLPITAFKGGPDGAIARGVSSSSFLVSAVDNHQVLRKFGGSFSDV
jgi:hypothetical protein